MSLEKAIDCLKNGEIIIYPTESCYAFGCDGKNKGAIRKINQLKKRDFDMPITFMVSDLDQIQKLGTLNKIAIKLSEKLMPGQINVIIDSKDKDQKGISFRLPANKIAFELCKKLNSPVTTTSVNIHGEPAIYDIETIIEKFENKVCEIIDVGDLDESITVSTIYDTRTKKIIREGPISKKEIDEILK